MAKSVCAGIGGHRHRLSWAWAVFRALPAVPAHPGERVHPVAPRDDLERQDGERDPRRAPAQADGGHACGLGPLPLGRRVSEPVPESPGLARPSRDLQIFVYL